MKRIFVLLLICALLVSASACTLRSAVGATPGEEPAAAESGGADNTRTIVDQAGREVVLPEEVDSAALIYGVATNFLLALDVADRLVAVNALWGFYAKVEPELMNTTTVGQGSLDLEKLAALNPDVFIHKASDPETLEAVAALGIPAVGIDIESTEDILEAITLLGEVFGVEERAAEIVDYYNGKIEFCNQLLADVPEEERPTAIVMGTEIGKVAGGSMLQSFLIETAGGVNCAKDVVSNQTWPTVGTETIFNWDPDYIFLTNSNASEYTVEDIMDDPTWSELVAVKNNHVLLVPSDVDSWEFPGVATCLGCLWMMSQMYPDRYSEEEFLAEVDEFYQFAYGMTFDREYLGY